MAGTRLLLLDAECSDQVLEDALRTAAVHATRFRWGRGFAGVELDSTGEATTGYTALDAAAHLAAALPPYPAADADWTSWGLGPNSLWLALAAHLSKALGGKVLYVAAHDEDGAVAVEIGGDAVQHVEVATAEHAHPPPATDSWLERFIGQDAPRLADVIDDLVDADLGQAPVRLDDGGKLLEARYRHQACVVCGKRAPVSAFLSSGSGLACPEHLHEVEAPPASTSRGAGCGGAIAGVALIGVVLRLTWG